MEAKIAFEHFIVDPNVHTLSKEGIDKRLEPKLVQLLCFFARHQGQVVTRDQLREAIWTDVVIGDETINRSVFALRNALGDDAKKARFISTIPKKGYQFLPEARELKSEKHPNKAKQAALWLLPFLVLSAIYGTFQIYQQQINKRKPPLIQAIVPFTQMLGSEHNLALNSSTDAYAFIGEDELRMNLYIKNPGQSLPHQMTDDRFKRWSLLWLDNHTLVYIRCEHISSDCSIVRNHEQREASILYESRNKLIRLAHNRKANQLLFSEKTGKFKTELKALNLLTGDITNLKDTYPFLPKQVFLPTLSDDDKFLYFVTPTSHGKAIKSLNLEAGGIETIAHSFNEISDLAYWSSTRLVAAAKYGQAQGIWEILDQSEKPKLLLRATGTEEIIGVEAFPEENTLYYENYQTNLDLFYFDEQSEGLEDLENMNSSVIEDDSVFSHDDRYLYLTSNRTGSKEIWQYDFIHKSIRQVTRLNADFMLRPAISYDNRYLAVYYGNEQARLAIINIDSGDTIVETQTDGARFPLNWSRNGKYFYASQHSNGEFSVLRFNVNTLEEEPIQKNAWMHVNETVDGQSLIMAMHGQDTLAIKNLESGNLEPLPLTINTFPHLSLGHVLVSDEATYVAHSDGTNVNIFEYPHDGTSSEDIKISLELPKWTWVSHIRSDGKAAMLEKHQAPSGNIMKLILQEK